MDEVWTHATWIVKRGREGEFVEAWREMAKWMVGNFSGAQATLLRDRDEPERFVSFGPWPSIRKAQQWRSAPEFDEHIARIHETLESFEPRLSDLIARVR